MAKIPTELHEWTVEAIRELIDSGVQEELAFDFKEALPDKRNDAEKLRICKSVAAFANGRGGFLVFGVKDKGVSASDRIVGVTDPEFVTKFSRIVGGGSVVPAVHVEHWNPPALDSGAFIRVVAVPPSTYRPHAVSTGDYLRFVTRIPGSGEPMSYGEIQQSFMQRGQQILALRQMVEELEGTRSEVNEVSRSQNPFSNPGLRADLDVFETLLRTSFPLYDFQQSHLRRDLRRFRSRARIYNTAQEHADRSLVLSDVWGEGTRRREMVSQHAKDLVRAIGDLLKHLHQLLTQVDPQASGPRQ